MLASPLLHRVLRTRRLEPRLGALEAEYQTHVLRSDIRQAQAILLLSVAAHVVWLTFDALGVGVREPAADLTAVTLETALTLGCALALRHVSRTEPYELIAFGWSLSWVVFVLWMRTRGSTVYTQAGITLMALTLYVGLPNRLSFRLIPAAMITIGDWWLTSASGASGGSTNALFITYGFVHGIGLWTSTRANTSRRTHFAAHREGEIVRHELSHAAHHDALTGVLSRARWLDLAASEMARHRRYDRPLTLLMADLDHFKRVNDEYGHEAGDRVLERFGRVLTHECRRTDIVGRIGGEEFAVLLPDTELSVGNDVGQRVIDACRCPQPMGATEISVSCSVGVATLSPRDLTIEDVLRRADVALYGAKGGGRNRLETAPQTAPDPRGARRI